MVLFLWVAHRRERKRRGHLETGVSEPIDEVLPRESVMIR
jgi:hypothetical protein